MFLIYLFSYRVQLKNELFILELFGNILPWFKDDVLAN